MAVGGLFTGGCCGGGTTGCTGELKGNLSGNAVRYWKEQEGIDIDRILVAVDDIALPFGLFTGGCCGGGTTGGTGELNGAYDGVLGIHQFEAFEVEVAHSEALAEAVIRANSRKVRNS